MLNDDVDLAHLNLVFTREVHVDLLLHSEQLVFLPWTQSLTQVLIVAFVVVRDHLKAAVRIPVQV